jgi:hypothetical protein
MSCSEVKELIPINDSTSVMIFFLQISLILRLEKVLRNPKITHAVHIIVSKIGLIAADVALLFRVCLTQMSEDQIFKWDILHCSFFCVYVSGLLEVVCIFCDRPTKN